MAFLLRFKVLAISSFLFFILLFNHSFASETVANNNIQPALWKVEHQGTTSYLLGSIHIGKNSWYPLPSYITDAFNASDKIVVELDALDNSAMMSKQMMLPAGQTLKNNISPQTYEKIKQYLSVNGMQVDTFSQFKPWAVATVISIIPYLKSGLDPELGIDAQLITQAKDRLMEVIELEKAQFQIDLLSKVFSDEKMLIELLEQPEEETQQLINFWTTGNIVKINDLMQQQMSAPQRELMLTSRNTAWIKKLDVLFNSKTSHFIVVGAAHLAGPEGVPTLLTQSGFKVTRIK